MDNKVCVVVFAYSATPSYYELISFQQCFKILGRHDIYVVAPNGLDLSAYKKLVPDFQVKYVSEKWMASKLDYNKLKLSQFFYKLFSGYSYLLTYELDAFVFTDNLAEWCGKGYDYIGAPWFDDYDDVIGDILRVGNSGFSLRKIATMQEGIKSVYYLAPTSFGGMRTFKYLKKSKEVIFKTLSLLATAKSLFYNENASIQTSSFLYEDRVIAEFIPRALSNFNMAPVNEAIKFSFEENPEVLFGMNKNALPMGCHAWWRYNLPFWKPYIESYGYKL